jgi:hypothetical protein
MASVRLTIAALHRIAGFHPDHSGSACEFFCIAAAREAMINEGQA